MNCIECLCEKVCKYNDGFNLYCKDGFDCPHFKDKTRFKQYEEIIELYNYCKKISIPAKLETIWDGYAIRFPNGGDFVQHRGSYGSLNGCVEPAISCRLDYSPVPLKNAKALVKRHKERLCKT